MISPRNLDWLDDHGERSSPPWCHFSSPAPQYGEDTRMQCCLRYHHCPQQATLPFRTSSTNRPSSLFVSRNCSIQNTTDGIQTLEEVNFFENQEESVTEVTLAELSLTPVRTSPGLHFDTGSTDLVLSDIDVSGTGRQFPSFQTNLGMQPSADDLSTQYTLEYFERYFPYEQTSTRLQPCSTPSIFEVEHSPYKNDHSRRLDSGLATPGSSFNTLTETKQADLELVFNSTTGEQHKIATKRERRKTTVRECLHRKLIRSLGGQCKSCKRRKRRVSRT